MEEHKEKGPSDIRDGEGELFADIFGLKKPGQISAQAKFVRDARLQEFFQPWRPFSLSPKEQMVLNLRFGLLGEPGRTLVEVGNIMEVSRQRILQIQKRAMRKFRYPDRSSHLRRFIPYDPDSIGRIYGFTCDYDFSEGLKKVSSERPQAIDHVHFSQSTRDELFSPFSRDTFWTSAQLITMIGNIRPEDVSEQAFSEASEALQTIFSTPS